MSEEAKPAKGGGKGKKLLLIALPLLLVAIGAGLWFSGILPALLHGKEEAHAAEQAPAVPAPRPPVFFDMPDIVANLSVSGRRASYIKLRSKLELARAEDAAAVQAAMPRLLDLFTTYLRELRPEELRGSSGTQRLREELIARANLAVPPARVTDILFTELLLQ
ncbi:flagellar basal body-associated FliL family protein [Belnapia rosea]|uniref:Flagellar protein FliL n=1 Tax=Belnapia rosea TaxID=938405 RepID=A0A1G6PBC2_9PROT|nr:flagellar basal body-associated FliL family protein [Belnapia rosea]SDB54382.1 flagellar FliL protein [Belnapia rosea]SDC77532.1 flagellar FliL protein [Belnapia rosea]